MKKNSVCWHVKKSLPMWMRSLNDVRGRRWVPSSNHMNCSLEGSSIESTIATLRNLTTKTIPSTVKTGVLSLESTRLRWYATVSSVPRSHGKNWQKLQQCSRSNLPYYQVHSWGSLRASGTESKTPGVSFLTQSFVSTWIVLSRMSNSVWLPTWKDLRRGSSHWRILHSQPVAGMKCLKTSTGRVWMNALMSSWIC